MARVRYCQVERFPNINQNRKYVKHFLLPGRGGGWFVLHDADFQIS